MVYFGNNIYDLDEKKWTAIEEHIRFLDIGKEDNNKL